METGGSFWYAVSLFLYFCSMRQNYNFCYSLRLIFFTGFYSFQYDQQTELSFLCICKFQESRSECQMLAISELQLRIPLFVVQYSGWHALQTVVVKESRFLLFLCTAANMCFLILLQMTDYASNIATFILLFLSFAFPATGSSEPCKQSVKSRSKKAWVLVLFDRCSHEHFILGV